MPPIQQPPVPPQVPVQQPMPVEPDGKPSAEKLKHTRIILAGVGLLAFVLLITTLVFASASSSTDAKLKEQYAAGMADGKKAQSQADAVKYSKQVTSVTRTYEAPVKYGSFQITYPKAWNIVVDSTTSEPVYGKIHPEYVNWQSDTHALRFILIDDNYEDTQKKYDDMAKNSKGAISKKAATVSGIKGMEYTGKINSDDKNAVGTVIVLPLRDKSMLMQTDDNKTYGDAFSQMVSTAKLIP